MVKSYVTGHCQANRHEGTVRKTTDGNKEVPGCTGFTYTGGPACGCSCHDTFRSIRRQMEEAGIAPPPAAVPSPAVMMPSQPFAPARPSVLNDIVAPKVESQFPGLTPPDPVRSFDQTDTGRKARGELAYEVKRVCDEWVRGLVDADTLTPAVIASVIDEGNPPSTGAIVAVFQRWEKWGFAMIAQKPWRFLSYTPDGLKLGVAALETRYKKKERMTASARGRGVRT